MDVVAVAAVAENGVIGDGDTLPWDYPEEVQRYRDRVAGKTVAIGRRTFELFDEPPGGRQIVLSRGPWSADESSVVHARSVSEAIDLAERAEAPILYVLGGAAIYEAFLTACDRMLLSRIDGSYEGDVEFPDFDREEWVLVDEERFEGYTLETWESRESRQ